MLKGAMGSIVFDLESKRTNFLLVYVINEMKKYHTSHELGQDVKEVAIIFAFFYPNDARACS